MFVCHSQVLAELKEYATEVDVDFVRKAVRAIGRCAIKVEVCNVQIAPVYSFLIYYFVLHVIIFYYFVLFVSSNRPSAV